MFHFQQRYSVALLSKPTTEMKVSEKAKMRLNKYAKLLRRDAPSQGRPVEAKGLHHQDPRQADGVGGRIEERQRLIAQGEKAISFRA
jgi:hypothetical protein